MNCLEHSMCISLIWSKQKKTFWDQATFITISFCHLLIKNVFNDSAILIRLDISMVHKILHTEKADGIKKSENKLTNNNNFNVDLYFSDQTLLCCGASMLKVKRVLLLLIQGSSSPTNRELSSNQEEDSKENSRLCNRI